MRTTLRFSVISAIRYTLRSAREATRCGNFAVAAPTNYLSLVVKSFNSLRT